MFAIEIPAGYTAILKGPASAKCINSCRVFGGLFKNIEVPLYKQYPVEGPAVIYIEEGSVTLVAGSTIPEDWNIETEGAVALVGPTDSGKSSLSTYLVNRHVAGGKRVCVVDADVGQSDIGPPGFVTYSCTSAPVLHISQLQPLDGYYVGTVNLQGVEDLLVAGVVQCFKKASANYPHLIIINTPGWTTGRGLQMLWSIIDAVKPTVLNIGEVVLPGRLLSRPRHILQRGPQERRELRNYAYRRHISLIKKIPIPYESLAFCKWERGGLSCLWGRYVAADVEEPQRRGREIAVPPHYFKNVFAALYKKGRLVGYAVFEKFEPSPSAYVSTDDFDEVRVGKIRVDPHGLQELEPLP